MKYCRHKWSYKTGEETYIELLKEGRLNTNASGCLPDEKTCNKCLKKMWSGNNYNWHYKK